MSRKILAALAVIFPLIVGGGFIAFRWSAPDPTERFLKTVVARGNVEETVLAAGTFKPVRLVAVGAQVSGRIIALHVKVGDNIKKDSLVAEIDSVTQLNDLRTAQASLADITAQKAQAAVTLVNAELALVRQRNLRMSSSGTQADLETAVATFDKTKAQIVVTP